MIDIDQLYGVDGGSQNEPPSSSLPASEPPPESLPSAPSGPRTCGLSGTSATPLSVEEEAQALAAGQEPADAPVETHGYYTSLVTYLLDGEEYVLGPEQVMPVTMGLEVLASHVAWHQLHLRTSTAPAPAGLFSDSTVSVTPLEQVWGFGAPRDARYLSNKPLGSKPSETETWLARKSEGQPVPNLSDLLPRFYRQLQQVKPGRKYLHATNMLTGQQLWLEEVEDLHLFGENLTEEEIDAALNTLFDHNYTMYIGSCTLQLPMAIKEPLTLCQVPDLKIHWTEVPYDPADLAQVLSRGSARAKRALVGQSNAGASVLLP